MVSACGKSVFLEPPRGEREAHKGSVARFTVRGAALRYVKALSTSFEKTCKSRLRVTLASLDWFLWVWPARYPSLWGIMWRFHHGSCDLTFVLSLNDLDHVERDHSNKQHTELRGPHSQTEDGER